MEKVELVFIPSPLMGHNEQTVEFAKVLANRYTHLSISTLVMKLPIDPIGATSTESSSPSASSSHGEQDRLRFIHLPPPNPTPDKGFENVGSLGDLIIEGHKPHVRDFIRQRKIFPIGESPPIRIAACIVDMFCTSMFDVGKEFGIPTYVFFPSNASFLGLMLHLQTLHDEHGQDISELKDSCNELVAPSFANPVPSSVLPFVLMDKQSWSTRFHKYTQKYREAKGIIINTFYDLEAHALGSYGTRTPPVYPIGPVLSSIHTIWLDNGIMQWLDSQPQSSVVFLCFGSRGGFKPDQVRKIANALECSGHRFLWSLRQPPPDGVKGFPRDYADLNEVLPEGFLERTAGIGKVIGWAPQTAVLSHVAVGGFASHCGWNSILESLWWGVPIATWPLYAEQQLNAFQLVKEMGLGVEISLDYDQSKGGQAMVTAEVIEEGIRRVMDGDSEVRRRVKEMKDKSRMALEEGGSSYKCLEGLVNELMYSRST